MENGREWITRTEMETFSQFLSESLGISTELIQIFDTNLSAELVQIFDTTKRAFFEVWKTFISQIHECFWNSCSRRAGPIPCCSPSRKSSSCLLQTSWIWVKLNNYPPPEPFIICISKMVSMLKNWSNSFASRPSAKSFSSLPEKPKFSFAMLGEVLMCRIHYNGAHWTEALSAEILLV